MMAYLLTRVVDAHGTASRLRSKYDVKGKIAAKTGTSNDNRDGWFLAFMPKIALGAWVGGEPQIIRFQDTSLGRGSSTALPICAQFLNDVYKDSNFEKWTDEKFPPLDSLTMAKLDCYRPAVAKDTTVVDSVATGQELLGLEAKGL